MPGQIVSGSRRGAPATAAAFQFRPRRRVFGFSAWFNRLDAFLHRARRAVAAGCVRERAAPRGNGVESVGLCESVGVWV